jgi:hypothetical protein
MIKNLLNLKRYFEKNRLYAYAQQIDDLADKVIDEWQTEFSKDPSASLEDFMSLEDFLNSMNEAPVSGTGSSDSMSFEDFKRRVSGIAGDIESAPTEPVRAGSSGGGSAARLYQDLFASLGNRELSIAMVANAEGESGIKANANGDCGSYGQSRNGIDTSKYPDIFRKPDRGECCSFGLWQFNICGGLGVGLLEHYGVSPDSSDAEKIPILTDYGKQVDFMAQYVSRKFNINQSKSIDEWVEMFVYQVERPADMAGATARRQEIARGLAIGLG